MKPRGTAVCHLTSVHEADDTRILRKECASLVAAGYRVTLVAPSDGPRMLDGVNFVPLARPSHRLARMALTSLGVLGAAFRAKAEIYHFHDPELIPVGLLLRAIGKRVVYDVHEDVPADLLDKDYLPLPVRRLLAPLMDRFERLASRGFSRVMAATPAIARRFPPTRTCVVQNFPHIDELHDDSAAQYSERAPLAVFVGLISELRGAREMLSAASILGSTHKARLALAGSFDSSRLESELRATRGWRHTDFLGQSSRAQVRHLLGQARAALVLFHPAPNHLAAQPNKLFEYMSAGLPIVASDFPLWRRIVEETGCGLLADPLDPEAIAAAIGWLLDHSGEAAAMGARGRQAVIDRLNWPQEERQLLECYEALSR